MRIYVVYAKVDEAICKKIGGLLEVHDVFIDPRERVDATWWENISGQIHSADCFLYLVSPESVDSPYCNREIDLIRQLKRPILPVIVKPNTTLPISFQNKPHINMSEQLTIDGVKSLLNQLLVQERRHYARYAPSSALAFNVYRPPMPNRTAFMEDLTLAYESENYDRVVYLLRLAKYYQIVPIMPIDTMLFEAEEKLQEQIITRDCEFEYHAIHKLLQTGHAKIAVCAAFEAFKQKYPNYDPKNIARLCSPATDKDHMAPNIDWVEIPEGPTLVHFAEQKMHYMVEAFRISKYPITNAQYEKFITASDGYSNSKWWAYSEEAQQWRKLNPTPVPASEGKPNHPRVNVSYYEALAFCQWLGHHLQLRITLPADHQWIRAARGSVDQQYPWSNRFNDGKNSNTRRWDKDQTTTPVDQFPQGASPFGVMDMSGNVWEWCSNVNISPSGSKADHRMVRGGSFRSVRESSVLQYHEYRLAASHMETVGFRIVEKVVK